MPYKIIGAPGGKFQVMNPETKRRFGVTTKPKAEKQRRLLYAIESGGLKPRK